MDETFVLTIEPAQANLWPIIGMPTLLFWVGIVIIGLALIIAIIAWRLRYEEAIDIAAVLTAGIGIGCIIAAFIWYNYAYAGVQNAWNEATARQQEAALIRHGFTNVHVTPFLGTDEHLSFLVDAREGDVPMSGVLTPTQQDNVFDAFMYPTNTPRPTPSGASTELGG